MCKPGPGQPPSGFSDRLADSLRRIGGRDRRDRGEPAAAVRARGEKKRRLGCVAIGGSTGGLHALCTLLRSLPARLGAPILVTQHLPPVFMPFFARQIEAACGRTAQVATDGLVLEPEHIAVAPGDCHLGLQQVGAKVVVRLDSRPAAMGYMPSVDVMLAAVAELYGSSACAVVLSGMGRDGLAGARRIALRGGAVLVQDSATSAVWGMPGAIAEAGLADEVLPPQEIALRIAARRGDLRWK